MRLLLICLTLAACGLPSDIVGPTDAFAPAQEKCPTPEPGSGIEQPVC